MSRHPLLTVEVVVLVAIGGFAGANLRYLAAELLPGLPGTLLANVLGATLLGFLLYEAELTGLLAERTHVVVGTGFLSSFTTYSTFVVQSLQQSPLLLAGNVVATYALGFAGVLVGRRAARAVDARWAA
ncbi:CrcB family protein [Halocalculus aciditolerans]|uniref:Fluoride-specific ion channel FluC n=1 Tax=Halocalculus aciditolerans TaxID=1383812 RepID=A0A830FLN2_9EURY|nr:CrcB family protein [Halocalculus aciditolerans]GGL67993.1 hypothetical protein GCM10009039_27470 [Halocalculus aciditolerans]